jgi:phage/plasmid-like protein (TIGR03299 family)
MTEERLNAWERLGTPVGESTTALDAMEAAGLAGWDIRKSRLQAIDEKTGKRIDVTEAVGVIRDKGRKPSSMAVVGPNYHIIQNEEHAELLDFIAGESGAVYENAGEMSDGRKVFITMRLPNPTLVGGQDRVDNFIAAVNGHDGTMSFHFMTTPIRFTCANMLNVGLEHSTSSFRIRHSVGAPALMKSRALQALKHTEDYLEEFGDLADQMAQTPLTEARFEQIIRKEFGAKEEAPQYTKTRCENKIAHMLNLFTEAQTNAEIRGTVWGGFNAITEWSDHFSHTRRQERSIALATKAINDPGVKMKAVELMSKEIR